MNRMLLPLLLLLAACTGPMPRLAAQAPAAASAPAERGVPVKLDTSCRSDADCTIKNVGNCCGAYPACVNTASPTDPKGVQAQCQANGMMSVCGFPQIDGCQCVAGQCSAKRPQADTLRRPIDNPEPIR